MPSLSQQSLNWNVQTLHAKSALVSLKLLKPYMRSALGYDELVKAQQEDAEGLVTMAEVQGTQSRALLMPFDTSS